MRTDLLGTDGFQEADMIGITMPVVKHSFMIQHPLEIPRAIHEAFHLARTGRPGPVVVDIPVDLSRADIPYEPVTDVHLPGYQPTTEGNAKQIRQAAKALAAARRPVLYVGGGVVNANASRGADASSRPSDRFPVTCTLMGLGAFPAPHEQWLGMLGMHGTRAANYAMDEADLIVAIGARFDDRITGKLSEFAPRAKFIHIDVDPAEISKNVPAHIPIVGDAQEHPRQARWSSTARWRPTASRLDEWWQRIREWQRAPPAALRGLRRDTEIKPAADDRRRSTRRPAATRSSPPTSASTRCGRRSTSTSTRPRRWINSGGLGHDGLRPARRRWARRSAAPTRPSSASPATARCR